MNVNKARPRHAPTWRKAFKWTHFTTISKREWISTVIVYVYEVIWSIHFHSIKWNYDNRIGESPWRSWCYLICIITRGLCSYNARLFNHDVTAIGASYWRRREFPNYARLHRGRINILRGSQGMKTEIALSPPVLTHSHTNNHTLAYIGLMVIHNFWSEP